jgi:hypothetical protein
VVPLINMQVFCSLYLLKFEIYHLVMNMMSRLGNTIGYLKVMKVDIFSLLLKIVNVFYIVSLF